MCLHWGQKNIDFVKSFTNVYDSLNFVGPYVIEYGEFIQCGLNPRGIQPISFRGCIVISQSDFSKVENRSEEVLRYGDFSQWGFKPRGTQPISFRGSIAIIQSDFDNAEN